MSLAFIEFVARILGHSLEAKIFLIRKKERKKERKEERKKGRKKERTKSYIEAC